MVTGIVLTIVMMIILVAMYVIASYSSAFAGGMFDLIYFCYLTGLFACLVYIVSSELEVDYLKVLPNIHLNKQRRNTKNVTHDVCNPADVEPVSPAVNSITPAPACSVLRNQLSVDRCAARGRVEHQLKPHPFTVHKQ
jgi:hypothetical protein